MIEIEEGKSTPRVLLDEQKQIFLIEGQSYPENSNLFYAPIIKWLQNYVNKEYEKLIFQFKLLYVNTSSTKALFYILDILEEAFESGKDIHIKWFYDSENEMAKETGEELLEDIRCPHSIIEVF